VPFTWTTTLLATEPAFRKAVEEALAPLRTDARVTRIRTAWDRDPPEAARLSRDGRRTWVTVELTGRVPAFASMSFGGLPPGLYPEIRGRWARHAGDPDDRRRP
jgi:hypothetical protein